MERAIGQRQGPRRKHAHPSVRATRRGPGMVRHRRARPRGHCGPAVVGGLGMTTPLDSATSGTPAGHHHPARVRRLDGRGRPARRRSPQPPHARPEPAGRHCTTSESAQPVRANRRRSPRLDRVRYPPAGRRHPPDRGTCHASRCIGRHCAPCRRGPQVSWADRHSAWAPCSRCLMCPCFLYDA